MENIFYTVMKIDGDYAHLLADNSAETMLVARALLPFEIDENTRLLYKDYEYLIM